MGLKNTINDPFSGRQFNNNFCLCSAESGPMAASKETALCKVQMDLGSHACNRMLNKVLNTHA